MPRKPKGAVLAAVEEDLAEIAAMRGPRASAGLQATARVLAGVLDGDAPATAKVAASKTLVEVLSQLRGVPESTNGGGDAVSRGRAAQARRRGAAA